VVIWIWQYVPYSQEREVLFLLGHFCLKFDYFVEANKAYVCANEKCSKDEVPIQRIYSLSIVNSYLKNMNFEEDLMMIVHNQLRQKKLNTKLVHCRVTL